MTQSGHEKSSSDNLLAFSFKYKLGPDDCRLVLSPTVDAT